MLLTDNDNKYYVSDFKAEAIFSTVDFCWLSVLALHLKLFSFSMKNNMQRIILTTHKYFLYCFPHHHHFLGYYIKI